MNALMKPFEGGMLGLSSKDINAISTFAQKRSRLPATFLLSHVEDIDDISDDAKEIIRVLLHLDAAEPDEEFGQNASRYEEVKKVAEYFADWAVGRREGAVQPR